MFSSVAILVSPRPLPCAGKKRAQAGALLTPPLSLLPGFWKGAAPGSPLACLHPSLLVSFCLLSGSGAVLGLGPLTPILSLVTPLSSGHSEPKPFKAVEGLRTVPACHLSPPHSSCRKAAPFHSFSLLSSRCDRISLAVSTGQLSGPILMKVTESLTASTGPLQSGRGRACL